MTAENVKAYKKMLSLLSDEEKIERDIYLRRLALGEIQGPATGYASIDKPWLKYYPEDGLRSKLPNKSMFEYFRDAVKGYEKQVGLDLRMSFNDFKSSVRKITYGQILDEITTVACGLKALGVSSDEIVVQMIPNLIESREAIYATNATGATFYPISPMIPSKKTAEIIDGNNVKTVIVYGGFYEKFKDSIENSKAERIIYLNGLEAFNPIARLVAKSKDKKGEFDIPKDDRIITWSRLLKEGKKYRKLNNIKSAYDLPILQDDSHIAAIIGTSGTTGMPKGSCLSDRALNAGDFAEQIPGPFKPGDTNLDVLIQSISYGLGIMHHTMSGKLYNYIVPELVTDRMGELLVTLDNPDNFTGGPIHFKNIERSKEYKSGQLTKHKNYVSGGATLDKELEQALNGGITEENENVDSSTIFVKQGMGLTENTGTGIYTTRGSYKLGSVGVPIAHSNAGIFKLGTDEELQYGEVGEICLTGPTMMERYLNNPEETAKIMKTHSDGSVWLHTEDEGWMDQDGNVFITDRFKNIFMRNGFNVHPKKIGELINTIDNVEDSYVIGVDHPIEMCVPVAFVILKDESKAAETEKEILSKCYQQMEEYFVPYEVVFVKDFPRNLSGKVIPGELVAMNNIDYKNSKVKKINLR